MDPCCCYTTYASALKCTRLDLLVLLLISPAASRSTPPGLSAVRGALVRCKRGGRYSWQQVKRAVQQSPGAWRLDVGQVGQARLKLACQLSFNSLCCAEMRVRLLESLLFYQC